MIDKKLSAAITVSSNDKGLRTRIIHALSDDVVMKALKVGYGHYFPFQIFGKQMVEVTIEPIAVSSNNEGTFITLEVTVVDPSCRGTWLKQAQDWAGKRLAYELRHVKGAYNFTVSTMLRPFPPATREVLRK